MIVNMAGSIKGPALAGKRLEKNLQLPNRKYSVINCVSAISLTVAYSRGDGGILVL